MFEYIQELPQIKEYRFYIEIDVVWIFTTLQRVANFCTLPKIYRRTVLCERVFAQFCPIRISLTC